MATEDAALAVINTRTGGIGILIHADQLFLHITNFFKHHLMLTACRSVMG